MDDEEEGRVSVQAIRGKFEQLQDNRQHFNRSPSTTTNSNVCNRQNKSEQEVDYFLPSERLQKLSESNFIRHCNRTHSTNSTNKATDVQNQIFEINYIFQNSEDLNDYNTNVNNQNEEIIKQLNDVHEDPEEQDKSNDHIYHAQDMDRECPNIDNAIDSVEENTGGSLLLHSNKNESFENKHRIIEGVVKSIKNNNSSNNVAGNFKNENSKLIKLRKLSVISKLEKDLKNKQQKNVEEVDFNSNISENSPGKLRNMLKYSLGHHKMCNADKKLKVDEHNPKSVIKPCIETAAISVMKAASVVADIETSKHSDKKQVQQISPDASKNSMATPPSQNKTNINNAMLSSVKDCVSYFNNNVNHVDVENKAVDKIINADEIDEIQAIINKNCHINPPTRPPRRKCSNGVWPSPKKKGKAPLPPVINIQPNNFSKLDTESKMPSSEYKTNVKQILPNNEISILSKNDIDNIDNIIKDEVAFNTCSNEQLNAYSKGRNYRDGNNYETSNGGIQCSDECLESNMTLDRTKETLDSSYYSRDNKTEGRKADTHFEANNNIERQNIELTPIIQGPPPKKPPRTFAYEIYKEFKNKNHLKPAVPVYAQPVKIKKLTSNHEIIHTPPIRSKSDLMLKKSEKPSIAPKPTNIANKSYKRLSMVEPISNGEKGSLSDISEFQRQAHIRFSLRRPQKRPPPHPQNVKDEYEVPNFKEHDIHDKEQFQSLDFESKNCKLSNNNLQEIIKKKSMSDETLYKGRSNDDDPIYAMPTMQIISNDNPNELHYMCSVLYPDEIKSKSSQKTYLSDNPRKRISSSEVDISKNKVNIISFWKQEFRQSCRQMQNKFKKNVSR